MLFLRDGNHLRFNIWKLILFRFLFDNDILKTSELDIKNEQSNQPQRENYPQKEQEH